MGIIERLIAGIIWNGYRCSLDCILTVGKEADRCMEEIKEREDN